MTTTRRMLATLALVLPGVLAVGCTDDDEAAVDDAATETDETRLETTGATSDATAYCLLSQELGAAETQPTDAQLAEIENVAPPEISESVRTLAEAIRNDDMSSTAAQGAEADLRDWEAENCGQDEAEAPDDNEQPGQVGGVAPPETEGGTEAGD